MLLGASLLASGCVYRMNIQQGNYLESRSEEQLQVGMTRSQVRYLLGTPMVPDTFDHDRWDYLYYMKKGRLKAPEKRRLTVYFQDDKVARIERHGEAKDPVPDEPPVVEPKEAPEPATVRPPATEPPTLTNSPT
jgi:outer membrane protein assembly factor BamE